VSPQKGNAEDASWKQNEREWVVGPANKKAAPSRGLQSFVNRYS